MIKNTKKDLVKFKLNYKIILLQINFNFNKLEINQNQYVVNFKYLMAKLKLQKELQKIWENKLIKK